MKIIAPLKHHSIAEIEKSLSESNISKCDMVEVWLDKIENVENLAPILKKASDKHGIEFLAVCKAPEENGDFEGDENQRVKRLLEFLQQGGHCVDLDIRCNDHDTVKKIPANKLWLSYHDFVGVPENLPDILHLMQQYNPEVYKFAVTVDSPAQLGLFLDFVKSFPEHLNGVFTTMGRLGLIGRTQLQSVSYAGFYALNENQRTANGQPTLDDLEV